MQDEKLQLQLENFSFKKFFKNYLHLPKQKDIIFLFGNCRTIQSCSQLFGLLETLILELFATPFETSKVYSSVARSNS